MNKAFVKESDGDDDDLDQAQPAIPAGAKNYITPAGHKRLRDELLNLIDVERPEVVRLVSWAASNGDRSENGDYIYGKRRLREIDRRIRFLTKRLDLAEVVDASRQENVDQVFFGATVDYETPDGGDHTITIVGIEEVDLDGLGRDPEQVPLRARQRLAALLAGGEADGLDRLDPERLEDGLHGRPN